MRKPVICFVGGDSGEGKSWGVVKIEGLLLELMGQNIAEHLDDINVYVPIQYPKKLEAILYDKRLKKINIIAIHEARDVIKAKMWHSFVSMAVADVNAQVRSVKRMIIFIISQFIRDITTDMRYTLTYYMTCHRPMGGSGYTRIRISRMWKDDTDLEKPKLKKRKISGVIIFPDGTHRVYRPAYLEITPPAKELTDAFEKNDKEAKSKIIKGKLEKLVKEMELDLNIGNPKVDAMVKFYSENPDSLRMIGRKVHNKWKLNKDVLHMHDLTSNEFKEFQTKLDSSLASSKWFKIDPAEYTESAEEAEQQKDKSNDGADDNG